MPISQMQETRAHPSDSGLSAVWESFVNDFCVGDFPTWKLVWPTSSLPGVLKSLWGSLIPTQRPQNCRAVWGIEHNLGFGSHSFKLEAAWGQLAQRGAGLPEQQLFIRIFPAAYQHRIAGRIVVWMPRFQLNAACFKNLSNFLWASASFSFKEGVECSYCFHLRNSVSPMYLGWWVSVMGTTRSHQN